MEFCALKKKTASVVLPCYNGTTAVPLSSSYLDSSEDFDDTYQNLETDYVRDSWEDWSSSDSSSPPIPALQRKGSTGFLSKQLTSNDESSKYNSSSDTYLIVNLESSSGDEFVLRTSPVPRPTTNVKDTWKCVTCGIKNEWPLRYCSKCYKVRKGWLPSRPRKRKTGNSPAGDTKKSTSANSQESAASVSTSGIWSQESLATSSQTTEESGLTEDASTSKLCTVCGMKPCDSIFLHGNTAHQMCCYNCSKKIWPKRKDCPICRRQIQNVIKVFRTKPSMKNT